VEGLVADYNAEGGGSVADDLDVFDLVFDGRVSGAATIGLEDAGVLGSRVREGFDTGFPAVVGARVAVVHGGSSGGICSGVGSGVGSGVRGRAVVGETPAMVAMADGAMVVGAVVAVGVAVAGDVPRRKDVQSEEMSKKD
jgi:hypothetical protein